jgi:DNA-binding response OmpR family regulator
MTEELRRKGDERALIVVAEPDTHMKRLQRYFLERAGYEVDVVDDGEVGLERARTRRPRIVITEILLPRSDGLSLCRAIKADPATRNTRVLVFSILAAEERARQAGADAFLRKPLDDEQLLATVQSLLAQRETEG